MYLALLNAAIFLSLSGLHIYWVIGGQWGLQNAMPEQLRSRFLAPDKRQEFRWATLFVALGLFVLALLNLWYVDILPGPAFLNWEVPYELLAIALVFGLRGIGDFKFVGVFKKDRSAGFPWLDSFIYSPLCLFLAATHFFLFVQ